MAKTAILMGLVILGTILVSSVSLAESQSELKKVSVEMDEENYDSTSIATAFISGNPSTFVSIKIIDPSDNFKDNVVVSLDSNGSIDYTFDLNDFEKGVYTIIVRDDNSQAIDTFGVDLEAGTPTPTPPTPTPTPTPTPPTPTPTPPTPTPTPPTPTPTPTPTPPTSIPTPMPVDPPRKQIASGVAPHEVICTEGLELIFKVTNGFPACVKPSTATKLLERGWGSFLEWRFIFEIPNS